MTLPKHLHRLNLNAAGIDIGSKSHFVAVPEGVDGEPVREFECFTADLHRSADCHEIFRDYTPEVEAFNIDESWLDITHSLSIFGTAENIAYLIKARIKH